MYSNRLKSPVVACALLGVAAVSYIAYHFYRKSKKKSFLDRLKNLYTNDHELYHNDNLSDEESYDLVEPSDLSDFLLVEPSDPSKRSNHVNEDEKYLRYDKLHEVAYIEDVAKDGRPNKAYKILANPKFVKSASTSASSTHLSEQPERRNKEKVSNKNKKNKRDTPETYEGWTVLDNFTNYDGCAEELTYVEKTVMDLKENKSVYVKDQKVMNDELMNNNCCTNNSNSTNCCNFNNNTDNNNTHTNINNDNSNLDNKDTNHINNNRDYNINSNSSNKDNNINENKDNENDDEMINPESIKIYLKNFGCSHNTSDSEYMLGLLDEYGYGIANNIEESNLVIINSCTVKGPSEEGMVSQIKLAKKLGLPVIVSGCVPQSDKNNPVFNEQQISLLGVTQIDRIIEMVENSLLGRKMILLEKKELPQLDLPKIRKDKLIEIIPLSTGCLGSCTFCKTKHSRGVLGSYDIEVILDRVESCLKDDIKEIWLTSEDLGAYGIDLGTDIVTLMNSIISILPKNIMIRLGMSNPPYIKKHINEICDILKNENVYEFIHIPVQSFSDDVLDKMNREYHVDDFLYLVDTIRNKIPNCTIATDIITGFPTETQEDHIKTLNMLEKLKLPVVNISQFYPRKGTVASKMKQLKNKIGKIRSREVTEIFMSYETNSKYIGKEFKVYFNQINNRNQLIGHNKQYIKVILIITEKDIFNNIDYNSNNSNKDNRDYKDINHMNNNIKDNKIDNKIGKVDNEDNIDYNNIISRYYGTVQNVKIINSTKWHLEGVLV